MNKYHVKYAYYVQNIVSFLRFLWTLEEKRGKDKRGEIVCINIMIQCMGQGYVSAMLQITTQSQYLFLALRLIKSHCVRLVSFVFLLLVRTHRDSRAINYIFYHKYTIKKIIYLIIWRIKVSKRWQNFILHRSLYSWYIIVREKHR